MLEADAACQQNIDIGAWPFESLVSCSGWSSGRNPIGRAMETREVRDID